MRVYLTFTLLLLYCAGTRAQSLTEAVKFADSLLLPGAHKACLISYEFPERIQQLQKKAKSNLVKGAKLADLFTAKNIEQGAYWNLQYTPQYGLTKEEYDTLYAGLKNKKREILKDTFDIIIKKENGIISFNATRAATAFNALSININTTKIIYSNTFLTRQHLIQGGQLFAPFLYGYVVDWPIPIDKKNSNNFSGVNCFSVGNSSDDNRITLALLSEGSLLHKDALIIKILE